MRMIGELMCALSVTGELVRQASRMNTRVNNIPPTQRKYRARGIRYSAAAPHPRLGRTRVRSCLGSCVLVVVSSKAAFTSTSCKFATSRGAVASTKIRSAPADAIHRAAAVRGCADTADAGRRHRARDRPRAQHNACPYGAARGIVDILTIYDGSG